MKSLLQTTPHKQKSNITRNKNHGLLPQVDFSKPVADPVPPVDMSPCKPKDHQVDADIVDLVKKLSKVMLGFLPPVCSKLFSTVTLTFSHCLATCTAPCPFFNTHVTWAMTEWVDFATALAEATARVGMPKVAI